MCRASADDRGTDLRSQRAVITACRQGDLGALGGVEFVLSTSVVLDG